MSFVGYHKDFLPASGQLSGVDHTEYKDLKKLVYVVLLVYSRVEIDEVIMIGYIREIKGPIDPATVYLELRLAGNSGTFSVLLSGGLTWPRRSSS